MSFPQAPTISFCLLSVALNNLEDKRGALCLFYIGFTSPDQTNRAETNNEWLRLVSRTPSTALSKNGG